MTVTQAMLAGAMHDLARGYRTDNPGATLDDYIAHLEQQANYTMIEEAVTEAVCRHCDRPTRVINGERRHVLKIKNSATPSNITCRAASYDYNYAKHGRGFWDESLSETLRATPKD